MTKIIINKLLIISIIHLLIYKLTVGQSCNRNYIFFNKLSNFSEELIYNIDFNTTSLEKVDLTKVIIAKHDKLDTDENVVFLDKVAIKLDDITDTLKRCNFVKNASHENATKPFDSVTSEHVYSGGADYLGVLPARWLGVLPPFDAAKNSRVSPLCKQQSATFMAALNRFDIWALKMHDASAKLTSGLLNGNVNQMGDFDQCLSARSPAGAVQGQYCLTFVDMRLPSEPPDTKLSIIHRLTHSHYAFKNELEDAGHRVPRFSTIHWALCVPHGCTHQDVQLSLRQTLQEYLNDTDVRMKVKVDQEMCQVQRNDWLTKGNIIAISFFAAVFFLAIVSTVYEYFSQDPSKFLVAFSFLKNGRELLSLERSASEIQSVHGIRFMNAILLYVSHKSLALFFTPYVNRTDMAELLGQHFSVLTRACSLYTDSFIMLSGMLTMHSVLGRLRKGHRVNVFQEYFGRLLRIFPTFGALVLFYTWVLPVLGSGPQWNLVVGHQAGLCRKYWWRNMMLIHNYFGFENMCLTHTHHMGIDTQLFFTAPLLAMALWRWPRRTIAALTVVAAASTVARFYVTMKLGLSNYVFFGTSVKQLFATADNMYTLPAHRATVYIMGLLLGAFLKSFNHIVLSKAQIRGGWLIGILVFCAAFFGASPMGLVGYKYDPLHAANYAAFAPIGWCLGFAWVIFVAEMGYTNFITELASWRGFMVFSRIAYAFYLTQFPVFFYNVGGTRTADHFSLLRTMINIKELGWTIFCSVLLTLLFDFPFQNIKKAIFPSNAQKIRANSQVKQHGQ